MDKRTLIATVSLIALVGRTAHAADLALPSAPVFTWDGPYAGVHGGALLRDSKGLTCDNFVNLTGEDGEELDGHGGAALCFRGHSQVFELDNDWIRLPDGGGNDDHTWNFLGGGQIGIRGQKGRFVLGLEGDIAGVFGGDDESKTTFEYYHILRDDTLDGFDGTGTVKVENDLDWMATIRGSVGVALGSEQRLLVYATGGLAIAGVDSSISGSFDDSGGVGWCDPGVKFPGGCTFGKGDSGFDIQAGYTIGAGAEYAFTNKLSLGLQYLFAHFEEGKTRSVTFYGDRDRSFDIEHNSALGDVHSFTARLNWRFGGQ